MKFRLTGEYGELAEVRNNVPHHGLDFSMPEGTTLRSISDGVVEQVVNFGDKNLGKGVFIRNEDGSLSIYGHMSDIDVKVGEQIEAGEIIGLSGNTGNSTGAHLHFGLKDEAGNWVDPTPIAEQVAEIQGADISVGSILLDKYNAFADKVIGGQVEFLLKPVANGIGDAAKALCHALTDVMPEIGAVFTVVCAIGIMFTGNVPKWAARWAAGLGGMVIWLINA